MTIRRQNLEKTSPQVDKDPIFFNKLEIRRTKKIIERFAQASNFRSTMYKLQNPSIIITKIFIFNPLKEKIYTKDDQFQDQLK